MVCRIQGSMSVHPSRGKSWLRFGRSRPLRSVVTHGSCLKLVSTRETMTLMKRTSADVQAEVHLVLVLRDAVVVALDVQIK